jgi:muramoyltetrapeptide carboxypeptidase
MFAQLALAGFFRKVRGLILGDFTDLNGKPHSASWLQEIVKHYVGGRKIPVLTGLRAGHRHADVLLPIGGTAKIDRNGKQLTLSPLVRKEKR